MRWTLLRRGSRVRGRARQKLNALLASKLATARAWDLKETFSHFWHYKSVHLGRRLSGLLVLPGHAQPPRTDEKGGADAAHP